MGRTEQQHQRQRLTSTSHPLCPIGAGSSLSAIQRHQQKPGSFERVDGILLELLAPFADPALGGAAVGEYEVPVSGGNSCGQLGLSSSASMTRIPLGPRR
jgi:hypothetical protein